MSPIKQLLSFQEKDFIHEVLGAAAMTANRQHFEDCVVIDTAEAGISDAPLVVYTMDQPYFISHPNAEMDPFRFYGRWAAGTTCSDVIAMGARCRGFSLALAAPAESHLERITALVAGIEDVLGALGAAYEGGNFHSGELATVGMAWGVVSRVGLVRRSGAKAGDRIVVTGELGMGWLEYQLRKHGAIGQIETQDRPQFLAYKTMPIGPASAIAEVAEHGWFSSGMDLSDGLVEFLHTIRIRNNLGCVIDSELLPIADATRRNSWIFGDFESSIAAAIRHEPGLVALEPGYDTPLVHAFTVPPQFIADSKAIFAKHGSSLHVIGEVTASRDILLRQSDSRVAEIPPFWDDKLRQESGLKAWAKFLTSLG